MSDIVVLGSLNMDLVVKAKRVPGAGETISGEAFHMIPGGKGANQAAAVARLGGEVSMVGRVGADAFGPQLVENLSAQGVRTDLVCTDPDAPTGIAMIIVDESGENRIIVVAGANGEVDRSDLVAAEERIWGAKALVMQFEVPLAAVEHALDVAVRHGVPTILNPAPAYPVSDSFLSKVSYLILNESETKLLTSVEVDAISQGYQAAAILMEKGVGAVILTLGERGALVVTPEEETHIPTRPVKVVDTTAAGDAFVGGFTVCLTGQLGLSDAVRFANGAGTLAVTRLGAQTSLPAREEVEAFIASDLL